MEVEVKDKYPPDIALTGHRVIPQRVPDTQLICWVQPHRADPLHTHGNERTERLKEDVQEKVFLLFFSPI